jgi:hypothetical protein
LNEITFASTAHCHSTCDECDKCEKEIEASKSELASLHAKLAYIENYHETAEEEWHGSKAYRNIKLMVHCPKSFYEFSTTDNEKLPTKQVLLD